MQLRPLPGPEQTHWRTAHIESHSESDRTRTVNRLDRGPSASLESSGGLLASTPEEGSDFPEPQEQPDMNTKQPCVVERRMRFMPCTVEPSDSVAHARALLDERRIKHLPVVSNERLVGIVSANDLDTRAFSGRHSGLAEALVKHPDRVRINSVMTTDVRTVGPSHNLVSAARLIQRADIGALPVLEHGRLVGIISRSDLGDALGPVVKRGRTTKEKLIAALRAAKQRGDHR
jgi:CBS domain-containing protein